MLIVKNNNLKFDKKGSIKNFIDPLNKIFLDSFSNSLIDNFLKLEDSLSKEKKGIFFSLKLELFQKFCLVNQFLLISNIKYNLQNISYYDSSKIDLEDLLKSFDELIKKIVQGPEKSGISKKILRKLKNIIINKDNLSNFFFKKKISTKNITFFAANSELIKKYLDESKKKTHYLHREDFFSRIKNIDNKESFDTELAEKILQTLESSLRKDLVKSYHNIKEDLFKKISRLINLVDSHLKNLNNIPEQIILTSLSPIWLRMLATKTKDRNGKISMFDHGSGSGYYKNKIEYILYAKIVDSITTYSEILCDLYKFSYRNTHLKKKNIFFKPLKNNLTKLRKKNEVMIVPIEQDNNYPRTVILPSDLSRIDLLSRVSKKLNDSNISFFVKTHAEYKFLLSESYIKKNKLNIISKPFDELNYSYKNVIFFHPYTSLFKKILVSDSNIILLNIGYEFNRYGFNLLNKRCHIINCEIDKKGRVSLNLNLIKKFLGCKPLKYDFTKVYFK